LTIRRAGAIDTFERDYFLNIHEEPWPQKELSIFTPSPSALKEGQWAAEDWQLESAYIWRNLSRKTGSDHSSMSEAILRFPSAPLFGSQRKRGYQVNLDPINYHTIRILRGSPERRKANRVFLLFNGLNETDYLDFYYELSGFLLTNPDAACIIFPFPGHLMRYPMVGRYAERPLNRFISDPSDLFRQYLRFMVEVRWLLSMLVPVSQFPTYPGMSLLSASDDPLDGRCNASILSEAIEQSWEAIRAYSLSTLENDSVNSKRGGGGIVTRKGIRQTIDTLRDLLGWHCLQGHLQDYKGSLLPPPLLHVVGYSLGGYLAQSAFFTWPFALNSCTTMCSGGALPDLRLVKFAHEEEWRSVMHGLKYEIDSGILEGRIRFDPSENNIAGLPATLFSSFFRIFSDVFLQDPNGSYRSRVSEFSPRLLFVVGGNDPIVTTRSVLEASPPEGINMIEIAKLSHFVATDQGEWRDFWLPTVAEVTNKFAGRAETLAARSVLGNLWNSERTGPAHGGVWSPDQESAENRRNQVYKEPEALDSEHFQAQLTRLVEPLGGDGFLFILRNQLPTALMGQRLLRKRGAVPHYEDRKVRDYWLGLQNRRDLLLKHQDRIILVIPNRLNSWFCGSTSILSAKNEPTAHAVPSKEDSEAIWSDFLADWESSEALFRFDPEDPYLGPQFRPADELTLERKVRAVTRTEERFPIMNCLPDLWVGLSPKVINRIKSFAARNTREHILAAFHRLVLSIFEERTAGARSGTDGTKAEATDQVTEWLETGALSIIRVSGAESNPRFLGERIWHFPDVVDLLVHSSMALARCKVCKSVGDFSAQSPGGQSQ
jgi:pimeloyl-ACP methyl ester carboxylesterase